MSAYALRPRSPGELLDASFQLYRAHFAPVILSTAVLLSPVFLAYLLVPVEALGFIELLSGIFYAAAAGASAFLVSAAIRGAPLGVGACLRAVGERFFSLWGVAILQGLLIGIGLLLLILPGLYALVVTACVAPLVMIEGRTAGDALERSQDLVRGRVRAVGAVVIPAFLVGLFPAWGVDGVLLLAGPELIPERVTVIVFEMVLLLAQPFLAVCATLVYYDLRIRKEALDVQVAAEAIAAAPVV